MRTLSKFVVFCIVGGSSFLIDLVFFNIFYFFGFGFLISRILAVLIALIFNFTLNRNFTFNARGERVRLQISRYIVIYSSANIINILVGFLIVSIFGESLLMGNVATVSGVLAAIPVSFIGSLLWTFKKH